MEPTIYKPSVYKTPGIYKGAGGIYKGRGVYNDGGVAAYGLPFPDGEPLVYNGKTYKTKIIKNLLMQVEFFDEAAYNYNVHNGIKYYKATNRFDVESLVSSIGWRLALDEDIHFINQEIEAIKQQGGFSYNQLLNTQNLWSADFKGDNLTGIGMDATGYDYSGGLTNKTTWWVCWGGSNSTGGNGAVSFERFGLNNFGTGRNWNDSNYLPIIFVKDA